jgi:hypothetical protein
MSKKNSDIPTTKMTLIGAQHLASAFNPNSTFEFQVFCQYFKRFQRFRPSSTLAAPEPKGIKTMQ